jgi:UDP:flavonoid glycosyltransferase YjiC (YdhE family)
VRSLRLLVAMFQGGGNIPLLLPIVTRLVRRGHSVCFIVGPGVRASRIPISDHLDRALRSTGAHVTHLRAPDVHPVDAARPRRGVVCGWVPSPFRVVAAETLVARWIPVWAEHAARELERTPADVVVADFNLVGALVAAEAAGVPSVALVHNVYRGPVRGRPPWGPGWGRGDGIGRTLRDAVGTFVSERIERRDALPFLNCARRRLGLRGLRRYTDQDATTTRIVVLTSPVFDPPERFPANVRLVGTPLEESVVTPSDASSSSDDGRPLLLVSLSTLEQGQREVMQRILTAVASLPLCVLVTLGPALRHASFDAAPNVVLKPFVPHRSVLPHAGAVVSQCGLGTVMKALAHGVPLVCIPLVGDQPENAARVEALGAGVRLRSDAGVSEIRHAIGRVLEEPSFRVAAEGVARAIAGECPVEAAVAAIESIAQ